MPTFEPADEEIQPMLTEVMMRWHPELVEAMVTYKILFAFGGLKLHGWPCAATIKIVSLEDRVAGQPDVKLKIDGDRWQDRPEDEQRAILDHELYHLVVRREQGGKVKTDDCGRPKLGMRQHDFECGLFAEILKRHGKASIESQMVATIRKDWVQLALFNQ